jgi:uncharacterized membrane protein
MKKVICFMMIAVFCVTILGCGNTKNINGVTYDTYGLFNQADKKNDAIQYRIIIGNIVWSCILVETIIAPIYFLGFSMYEPVGIKNKNAPKGAV